jgi:hypothetical protein
MQTILVSLVSEQTIPNILGIRHFQPDELLFISTEEMEKKGKVDSTLYAVNHGCKIKYSIGRNVNVIQVREDSILDCQKGIEKWIQGREDSEFIVNLTGGTKIMSIATFEYFKDFGSRMIYMPLKNEYIIPFPKKTPKKPVDLDIRLNVVEYLAAYGLKVTNEHVLERNRNIANEREALSAFIVKNYNDLADMLRWLSASLRSERDKRTFSFSKKHDCSNEKEKEFLRLFGFKKQNNIYTKELCKSETGFLTGGWLEEYCFNIVSEFLGKGVDDAVIGISIKSNLGTDNEFDVMLTGGNTLYFIECKSLDQGHDLGFDVLYKIGALQKDFGLRVESFLVTTSPHIFDNTGRIKAHIMARAEQFKTVVVTPSEVENFKSFIAKKLELSDGETQQTI